MLGFQITYFTKQSHHSHEKTRYCILKEVVIINSKIKRQSQRKVANEKPTTRKTYLVSISLTDQNRCPDFQKG